MGLNERLRVSDWPRSLPGGHLSGADEASIEAAGEGDVGGAVDEGSAIGKDGEGVGAAMKAKQEGVGADVCDLGMGGEACLHGGEIDGPVVLVDLDGVAAAEADMRAEGAGEMGEVAEVTDVAAGTWGGGGDLGVIEAGGSGGLPQLEGDEGAAEEMVLPGKNFEGLGDLEGGGEVDGGREDAGGVAGLDRAGGGLREDAGEAGSGLMAGSARGGYVALLRRRSRDAGEDGHGGGVGGHGGGVDPGDALLNGEVVDKVAGFEVVSGVEDEIGGAEEVLDVGGDEVGDVGCDADGGVGGEELAAGGLGLGEGVSRVPFVEEDLALEIRGLNEVAIDEGEVADAGAGEERGGRGPGGADADDGDMGASEGQLAGLADAGKEDLAGVAFG